MQDFLGAQLMGGDFDFSASFRNFCQASADEQRMNKSIEVLDNFLTVKKKKKGE